MVNGIKSNRSPNPPGIPGAIICRKIMRIKRINSKIIRIKKRPHGLFYRLMSELNSDRLLFFRASFIFVLA